MGADGGPWPPQGSRGWSLLGVIASRGGGAECPMQMMRGAKGAGAFALQISLCSGEGVGLSSSKSITHWETVASTPSPP